MKISLILLASLLFIQCSDSTVSNTMRQVETKDQVVEKPSEKNVEINCAVDLNAAVLINDTVMLKSFLEKGCDVNTIINSKVNFYSGDTTYTTALSNTIDYNISRILLEAGANPNLSQIGGRSVLGVAIGMKKNDLAKLLINYKANVNHFNKYNESQSPAAVAVTSGNLEGLELLVKNGLKIQDRKKDENSLIHTAILRKQYDLATYLLESGVSSREKYTPFNPEGSFGDCVKCPFEIEPIHSAVQLNDTILSSKFIDLLLKHGADLNVRNKEKLTPLAYIASDGEPNIAEHLIAYGALVDDMAIIQSAAYQNNPYLEVLLNNGGNPNASSEYYMSPLHAAITCCGDGFNETQMTDRRETIQLLMRKGATPSVELRTLVRENERYSEIQFD